MQVRLINGAASTAFWIEFGALDATVIAVDGDAVHPVVASRFSIAEAQRVDVLVQVPPDGGAFPVLAQREGDRQRTGFILAVPGGRVAEVPGQAAMPVGPADLSLERRLRAVQPLLERKPDVVHRVVLTGTMMPYSWGIDGRAWANRRPLMIAHGQRVVIDIVNQTQMAHPMHLHGHRFQVVALNGRQMDGAMRDTVLVPTNGSVRIAFDADNPGRWLFHCHNLYHMITGMITEVNYEGFA
jgi:FtsP/CotA-like multicopper oxidase with cupredoxin domain